VVVSHTVCMRVVGVSIILEPVPLGQGRGYPLETRYTSTCVMVPFHPSKSKVLKFEDAVPSPLMMRTPRKTLLHICYFYVELIITPLYSSTINAAKYVIFNKCSLMGFIRICYSVRSRRTTKLPWTDRQVDRQKSGII